jgi:uncharacterized protein (TIGR02246 family)
MGSAKQGVRAAPSDEGGDVDMSGEVADNAVRELYSRLLDAWNRRSATDFGAEFAMDGSMVGFDGSQATGREIVDHLAPIFADHPTATYVAKVRDVRPIGERAVLLRAIAGMIPPGQSELKPDVNAVHSVLAEERGGAWRIVLFQNTAARYDGRPELTEQHLAELRAVLAAATRN